MIGYRKSKDELCIYKVKSVLVPMPSSALSRENRTVCYNDCFNWLWPPCLADADIIFCSYGFLVVVVEFIQLCGHKTK